MAFWNKRKEEKRKAEAREREESNWVEHAEAKLRKATREEVVSQIARVTTRVTKNLDREFKCKADEIAFGLDHNGCTKKEILALAYRQIREELTLENTRLDDHFKFSHPDFAKICLIYQDRYGLSKSSFPPQSVNCRTIYNEFLIIDQITNEDREAYLDVHIKQLTMTIDDLEQQVIEEKLRLLRKHEANEQVSQRVTHIKTEQQIQEAKLDQQLQAVDAKINQLYEELTLQKQKPTFNDDPDLDRLESMLEELRRLKNG